MNTSQQIVLRWIECAAAGTIVLLAARVTIGRLRQPADRIQLIVLAFLAAAIVPPLVGYIGLTGWRLAIVAADMPRPTETAAPSSPKASWDEAAPGAFRGEEAGLPRASTGAMHQPVAPVPGSTLPSSVERDRFDLWSLTAAGLLTMQSIVVAWLLAEWLLGVRWLRAMSLRAHRADMELQQLWASIAGDRGGRVRLLVSCEVDTPLTYGCRRPTVVIPESVASGDPAELRYCLVHEWSHVERGDLAAWRLASLCQFLLWFQPLFWKMRRELRVCQDLLADYRAANSGHDAVEYSEFLLAFARRRPRQPVAGAIAFLDPSSQLSRRIQMLLTSHLPLRSRSPWAFCLATGVLLVVSALLTSIVRIEAARADDGPTATAQKSGAAQAKEQSVPSADGNLEAGVVQGVLVNADGTPIAKAQVVLRGAKTERAESNSAGRFEFKNLAPIPSGYLIWARAGNLVVPETRVDQVLSAGGDSARFRPLRLEMREGKQLKFFVRSVDGAKLLEGAKVTFGYPDRREMTTDARGTALVQGLLGKEYEVTIAVSGHARETLEIDLSQAKEWTELPVDLAAGGVLHGVALDQNARPVAGAMVYYSVRIGYGTFGDAQRTDAQGRFQNSFLPLGKPFKVTVQHDDFMEQKQDVVLSDGNRELDIAMTLTRRPPGKSLAGVVRDTRGNPVAGARITNYGNSADVRREALTDDHGEFSFAELFDGYAGHQIYIVAKGFAPQRVAVEPKNGPALALVKVTLKPGHSIRGRVVDEQGRPVAEAWVAPCSGGYPNLDAGVSVQTREDGQFNFDSLPEDVTFRVSAPGYPNFPKPITLPLDGDEPVQITLESPGALHGRVVDARTRKPVRTFRVQLGFSPKTKPGDKDGIYLSSWSDPGITFNSGDGEFLIKPLTSGMPLALTVVAENYERTIVDRAVASKVREAEELTISLKPLDRSQHATLRVQLLDHAGRPAAGAQLRLIVSTSPPTGADDNRFNWVLIARANAVLRPVSRRRERCGRPIRV